MIINAVRSQVEQNFQGLSNVSAEKEEMMTMARTESATAQNSDNPKIGSIFAKPQSLLYVEDKMTVYLMNPISSLLNIISSNKLTQQDHIDMIAQFALTQLKRRASPIDSLSPICKKCNSKKMKNASRSKELQLLKKKRKMSLT